MAAMVSAEWVKEQGRAAGFDRVGIAPAGDLPELARLPAGSWSVTRETIDFRERVHHPLLEQCAGSFGW